MGAIPTFIEPLALPFELPPRGEQPARSIEVRSASVAQIGRMGEQVASMIDALVLLPAGLWQRLAAGEPSAEDVGELFSLAARDWPRAVRLVAIATRLEEAEVGELLADRFAYLFALVVQVNADFFARALPLLQQAAQKLGDAKAQLEPVAKALRPAAAATPSSTPTSTGPSSSKS